MVKGSRQAFKPATAQTTYFQLIMASNPLFTTYLTALIGFSYFHSHQSNTTQIDFFSKKRSV